MVLSCSAVKLELENVTALSSGQYLLIIVVLQVEMII